MPWSRAFGGSDEGVGESGAGAMLGVARAVGYPLAGLVAFLALWWVWIEF